MEILESKIEVLIINIIELKMTEIIRIPNIENYIQEIINGELILTPKEGYITEDEINKPIFTSSKIINCIVKNEKEIISVKTSYQSILNDIWGSMPTQKILQNTTFNMKLTNENGLNGYNWHPKLNLSIQGKTSNMCMKEILNMIRLNNYSMNITIQLQTGKIIRFNSGYTFRVD